MDLQDKSKETYDTIQIEFNRQVELMPYKLAIIEETRSLTYRELQTQSKELSQQLTLDNDPIVAILLPGGVDHVLSVFAVLNTGRAYSPLSMDYPAAKLMSMLQSIGNPLLITKASVLKEVDLSYKKLHLLDSEIVASKTGRSESIVGSLPKDTAAVYFTSGSTGVPKSCLIGNQALVRCVKVVAEVMKINQKDESVYILNPAFALSICDVLMSLFYGATIHVPPSHLRYDASKLREWVKAKSTITIMYMVCSIGEIFFNAEPEAFPKSLRLLMTAGEKLQTRPSSKIPFQVCNMYGSTESLAGAWTILGDQPTVKDPVTNSLVGQAFPDVNIYILDEETLKPLGIGEIGEIGIGGQNISKGYLNSPTETNQKFIQIDGGIRVVKMGDLGYMMPDGNLVVLNRRDNQVKVAGNRFDLSDLESALLQHSSVEKTVAVLEKSKDLRFHLFYSLKSNEPKFKLSENEINEFLKDRLPHYAFPHSVTRVDQFPHNAHGKLDKVRLLQMRAKDKFIEYAVTDLEKILVKIWSEVLDIPSSEISRNDNFFSIGGSSLTASKVVNALKDMQFYVEVFNIFKIPVLKNLAGFIAKCSDIDLEGVKDFKAELNSIALDFTNLKRLDFFNFKNPPKTILITGSTGYLGSSLLFELLAQTKADVFCLIRSNSQAEAQYRLAERLKSSELLLSDEYLKRLHFVPGNLSVPFFGLGEAEYNSLSKSIDHIYHCAAEVHWLKRYEELRQANVMGTVEILKFASTNKIKFLHYISTVGVLETSDPEMQRLTTNISTQFGYVQSKWVADMLVWKAINAGLPAIVYRPGIIGSHSVSNIVNAHDFIVILFMACRTMNAYPDLPWKFPYATLDFTTKSIVAISRDLETNCSKSFHPFQNIVSFNSFYDYFESKGLQQVSFSSWKDMVFAVEPGSPKFDSLAMIKLFLSDPYHQNLTIFALPYSRRSMSISNSGTMGLSERSGVLEESEQVQNFGDSVFACVKDT